MTKKKNDGAIQLEEKEQTPKLVAIETEGKLEKQVNPTPAEDKKEFFEDDGYNVEIIADHGAQIDPFILNKKDPNYHYRFLRDEPKNLSLKTSNLLLQGGGWQLVPRDHAMKVMGLPKAEVSGDGLVRRGDTVLARIPRHLYEQKEAHKIKKANASMDAVKRMVSKGDESSGIQTGWDLGMSKKPKEKEL